jgi:hypothetical protein
MSEKKKSAVEQLRSSMFAQAVDKALNATDKFLGPSGKAWFANGLDELRQVFVPGVQQIQPGNNPGLWGTITTGEATAERMAGDLDKDAALQVSYEVPQIEAKKEMTLDELRGYAKEKSQDALQKMDRSNGHTKEQERGGPEL